MTRFDAQKPDYSWEGLLDDVAMWSASLTSVRSGRVPPSYHRSRWSEEQDLAYAILLVALDAALGERFGRAFDDLCTDEGVYADLEHVHPELFYPLGPLHPPAGPETDIWSMVRGPRWPKWPAGPSQGCA